MGADFTVQVVCEEGVKLNAQHMSLGQQRAVLLDPGQKVSGHVVSGKYHGFSEEGAALGAADIKYVADTGNVCQCNICSGSCQPVCQAGSVHI